MIMWSLQLLGLAAVPNVVLGLTALVTGILLVLAGMGVAMPRVSGRD